MKQAAYCLFETPLGWCGIAWSEGPNPSTPYAVTLLQLPEATTELTESRIAQNSGAAKSSEHSFTNHEYLSKSMQAP